MIVKNNIAIRIAGKVSRYIDASMNRATPSDCQTQIVVCFRQAGVTDVNHERLKRKYLSKLANKLVKQYNVPSGNCSLSRLQIFY